MSMRVDFVVAKGKQELRRSSVHVEGGRIVDTEPAGAGAADITFTFTEPLAETFNARDLDLSVGFMRGQIKMAGDFGELLHLLPLTSGKKPAVAVSALL
jgi:hypothetical protein